MLTQSIGFCQSSWSFQRVDNGTSPVVSVQALVNAGSEWGGGTGDDSNEIVAFHSESHSVSDGANFASAQSMAEATLLTPIAASTFTPTVDTTISSQLIAQGGAAAGNFPDQFFGIFATSEGEFDVIETDASLEAWFHGSLYLAAVDLLVNNADLIAGLNVNIPGFASAEPDNSGPEPGWNLTAFYPGGSLNLTVPTLNQYIDFVVPIQAGQGNITFFSDMRIGAAARPSAGLSSLNAGFSASAWGVITPVGESPLEGDFDGDGD